MEILLFTGLLLLLWCRMEEMIIKGILLVITLGVIYDFWREEDG